MAYTMSFGAELADFKTVKDVKSLLEKGAGQRSQQPQQDGAAATVGSLHKDTVECPICNGYGHFSSDCPKLNFGQDFPETAPPPPSPSSEVSIDESAWLAPAYRFSFPYAPPQLPIPTTTSTSISTSSDVSTGPRKQRSSSNSALSQSKTPILVRLDQSGIQWIAFEYSSQTVRMEYTIRCDVESIDVYSLPHDFKSENCVYPRAFYLQDQYEGAPMQKETECNTLGWALAQLNPCLRGKRSLIKRAVDSWINANGDPHLRRRRVPRLAKRNNRNADVAPYIVEHGASSAAGSSAHHYSGPRFGKDDTEAISKTVAAPAVKFQCTFCRITLTEKSWRKHEESNHLPRSLWICMPHDSPTIDEKPDVCVFCHCAILDGESHNCKRIFDCVRRSREERTFVRKDHLTQHIKQFHQATVWDNVLASWRVEDTRPEHQWQCGFCSVILQNWNERATHISKHFRDGLDMSAWTEIEAPCKNRSTSISAELTSGEDTKSWSKRDSEAQGHPDFNKNVSTATLSGKYNESVSSNDIDPDVGDPESTLAELSSGEGVKESGLERETSLAIPMHSDCSNDLSASTSSGEATETLTFSDADSDIEDPESALSFLVARFATYITNAIMDGIEADPSRLDALRQCMNGTQATNFSSTPNIDRLSSDSGPSRSNKKFRDDDKGRRDDREEDSSRKRKKDDEQREDVSQSADNCLRFACQFFKHDPQKYRDHRSCLGPGWRTIHRLKEHLFRNHSQPRYCAKCFTVFNDDASLFCHLRENSCPIISGEPPDGLSPEQRERLRSRRRIQNRSEEDRWREIYSIAFPHVPTSEIPSPYYDDPEALGDPGVFRRELLRRVRRDLWSELERESEPFRQRLIGQFEEILDRNMAQLLEHRSQRQHQTAAQTHIAQVSEVLSENIYADNEGGQSSYDPPSPLNFAAPTQPEPLIASTIVRPHTPETQASHTAPDFDDLANPNTSVPGSLQDSWETTSFNTNSIIGDWLQWVRSEAMSTEMPIDSAA